MARRVAILAMLLLAGCIEEGRLSATGLHPCRSVPQAQVEPGGTYAWVNQTIVDLATQGWGYTSIRLIPCRTAEANFAIVSLPGAENQNQGTETHPYVLVMVYEEGDQPTLLTNQPTQHGHTFLRWTIPDRADGEFSPATNDWTMFLQSQTTYRLVIATNVNGYRVQIRDLNPSASPPVPWTTNVTLTYQGPMVRPITPDTSGSGPDLLVFRKQQRSWAAEFRPGVPAVFMVRGWLDTTAHRGNYTDTFQVRHHWPDAPPDYSQRHDGTMGSPLSPAPPKYWDPTILRPDSLARVERSLYTTSVGLSEIPAGVATVLVPLEATRDPPLA